MSTAAMNAVRAEKAGAASGILSMSRMVGGTFGVAALGALFQHLAAHRLERRARGHRHQRRPARATWSRRPRAAARRTAGGLPAARRAEAAHDAFIHALSSGMWLSAGVAAAGVRDRRSR